MTEIAAFGLNAIWEPLGNVVVGRPGFGLRASKGAFDQADRNLKFHLPTPLTAKRFASPRSII